MRTIDGISAPRWTSTISLKVDLSTFGPCVVQVWSREPLELPTQLVAVAKAPEGAIGNIRRGFRALDGPLGGILRFRPPLIPGGNVTKFPHRWRRGRRRPSGARAAMSPPRNRSSPSSACFGLRERARERVRCRETERERESESEFVCVRERRESGHVATEDPVGLERSRARGRERARERERKRERERVRGREARGRAYRHRGTGLTRCSHHRKTIN